MSSDTRSNSPDGDQDPETTHPAAEDELPLVNLDMDDDPEGEEATVMAHIPEELIASSIRKEPQAGLRQTFGRDPAPARQAVPTEAECDALLDMIFDDSRVEPAKPAEAPKPAEPAKAAPPPPRPRAMPPSLPTPAAPRATPPPAPKAAPPPEPLPELADDSLDAALEADDEVVSGAMLDDAEPEAVAAAPLRVAGVDAPVDDVDVSAEESTFDKDAQTMDMDPADLDGLVPTGAPSASEVAGMVTV